jgi:hypothetical protein
MSWRAGQRHHAAAAAVHAFSVVPFSAGDEPLTILPETQLLGTCPARVLDASGEPTRPLEILLAATLDGP